MKHPPQVARSGYQLFRVDAFVRTTKTRDALPKNSSRSAQEINEHRCRIEIALRQEPYHYIDCPVPIEWVLELVLSGQPPLWLSNCSKLSQAMLDYRLGAGAWTALFSQSLQRLCLPSQLMGESERNCTSWSGDADLLAQMAYSNKCLSVLS